MEILEILTVGLPFCAFKIVGGLTFHQNWLILLGIADFLINILNLFSVLLHKSRLLDACTLSFLIRKSKNPPKDQLVKWQDLGNSFDIVLSFLLVAIMIAGNFIKTLNPILLMTWNVSVIFNVFGAGLSRLTHSLKNLSAKS